MAVYRCIAEGERRQHRRTQRRKGTLHHDHPIYARIVLRPSDRPHVIVEGLRAFVEPSQVLILEAVAATLSLTLTRFGGLVVRPPRLLAI